MCLNTRFFNTLLFCIRHNLIEASLLFFSVDSVLTFWLTVSQKCTFFKSFNKMAFSVMVF